MSRGFVFRPRQRRRREACALWTKPKATRRSARHCAGRFWPLKNPWFWKEPRFLRPSDARNAHEICCGIRLWGAERKRVPCGHLGPKGPKRPGGGERNERRARPAPTATIERPGVCPKPRQGDDPPAPRTLSAAWSARHCAGRFVVSFSFPYESSAPLTPSPSRRASGRRRASPCPWRPVPPRR